MLYMDNATRNADMAPPCWEADLDLWGMFSDCYKDANGHRPRFYMSAADVEAWFARENTPKVQAERAAQWAREEEWLNEQELALQQEMAAHEALVKPLGYPGEQYEMFEVLEK